MNYRDEKPCADDDDGDGDGDDDGYGDGDGDGGDDDDGDGDDDDGDDECDGDGDGPRDTPSVLVGRRPPRDRHIPHGKLTHKFLPHSAGCFTSQLPLVTCMMRLLDAPHHSVSPFPPPS